MINTPFKMYKINLHIIVSIKAGLLARSRFFHLPIFYDSGIRKNISELTAAGTAPDFNRIPYYRRF